MAQRAQGSVYLKPIVKRAQRYKRADVKLTCRISAKKGEHLCDEAQWWQGATGAARVAGNCYIPPSYAHTCPQVCYIIGEKPGEVLRLCTFQ